MIRGLVKRFQILQEKDTKKNVYKWIYYFGQREQNSRKKSTNLAETRCPFSVQLNFVHFPCLKRNRYICTRQIAEKMKRGMNGGGKTSVKNSTVAAKNPGTPRFCLRRTRVKAERGRATRAQNHVVPTQDAVYQKYHGTLCKKASLAPTRRKKDPRSGFGTHAVRLSSLLHISLRTSLVFHPPVHQAGSPHAPTPCHVHAQTNTHTHT